MKLSDNAKAERERIKSRYNELIAERSKMDAYRKLGREFGKSYHTIMKIIKEN